jgi:hypothetical protein
MDQLEIASIQRIVVSTSVSFAPLIKPFVDLYVRHRYPVVREISVVAFTEHSAGPVPGLAAAIRSAASARYLICLADIFLYSLPLGAVRQDRNALFGDNPIASRPGWLRLDETQSRVLECMKEISDPAGADRSFRNWCGMALLQHEPAIMLSEWGIERGSAQLEDAFDFLLSSGTCFDFIESGCFENINTYRELQVLQTKCA